MLHPKSCHGQGGDHTLHKKPSIFCFYYYQPSLIQTDTTLHYLITAKEISVTIWQLIFVIQGKPPSSYSFISTYHRKLWHNGSPLAASLCPVDRAFTPGPLPKLAVSRGIYWENVMFVVKIFDSFQLGGGMFFIPSFLLQDLLGAVFSCFLSCLAFSSPVSSSALCMT